MILAFVFSRAGAAVAATLAVLTVLAGLWVEGGLHEKRELEQAQLRQQLDNQRAVTAARQRAAADPDPAATLRTEWSRP